MFHKVKVIKMVTILGIDSNRQIYQKIDIMIQKDMFFNDIKRGGEGY